MYRAFQRRDTQRSWVVNYSMSCLQFACTGMCTARKSACDSIIGMMPDWGLLPFHEKAAPQ